MENLPPFKLYEQYKHNIISKKELFSQIITVCEYSESSDSRRECLEIIEMVGSPKEDIFQLLETTAVTDSVMEVKLHAVKILLENFSDKALSIVKLLIESKVSREFIVKLVKIIGAQIILKNRDINEEYSKIVKPFILAIFNNQEIANFELLWDPFWNAVPEGFWDFLDALEDPIGIVEIWEYYINNLDIYNWFLTVLFPRFPAEKWLRFMDNVRFSGRVLYIFIYLAEEKPPTRFFRIVAFFNYIGKQVLQNYSNELIVVLAKNNLYDLAMFIIFRWCEYCESDSLLSLYFNTRSMLVLQLKEILINKKFNFLEHFHFMQAIISFMLYVHNNSKKQIVYQIFEEFPTTFKRKFIEYLLKMVNEENIQQSEMSQYQTDKMNGIDILKILSAQIDLKKYHPSYVNNKKF